MTMQSAVRARAPGKGPARAGTAEHLTRKHLLEYFTMIQVARKVAGVGSVGTRAWILLMDGADQTEPLFLQAKEAQTSEITRI